MIELYFTLKSNNFIIGCILFLIIPILAVIDYFKKNK